MLPSCLQTSEHNLGNCSSAHSLLLEPSRAGTRLPELPLPGRGVILCQPHVDKCHSGKVPVDTTGSQGKPALSGSVTTPGHQVSVASREPPIMSLQGPSAKPPTGRHRVLWPGPQQCYRHMRRSSSMLHLPGCQLTMQHPGWF